MERYNVRDADYQISDAAFRERIEEATRSVPMSYENGKPCIKSKFSPFTGSPLVDCTFDGGRLE
jgi:hypothetical protein